MSTTQEIADNIAEKISLAGDIRTRKMFGEYAVYCDDKVVSLICDNRLFVKITSISSNYLDSSHEAPPYPGAKNSLLVPASKMEDKDWLASFIRDTSDALPRPNPKRKS